MILQNLKNVYIKKLEFIKNVVFLSLKKTNNFVAFLRLHPEHLFKLGSEQHYPPVKIFTPPMLWHNNLTPTF